MKKISFFFTISIVSLFVLYSCSSTKKSTETSFSKITIGSIGGAVGAQNGFTIDSVGRVFVSNGKIPAANSEPLGILTPEELQVINKIIIDNKLFEMNYQVPYNMSNFIKIEKNDKNNYIVWNPNEKNSSTETTNRIYNEILNIVNKHK